MLLNLIGEGVRSRCLWPLRPRRRRRRPPPADALSSLILAITMKVLYPASHDIPQLSPELLAIKIARHSSCSLCSSCSGLRPPPNVEVALDSAPQKGPSPSTSRTHGATSGTYLQFCSCGHDTTTHGADPSSIGKEEFARRGRVAVRLDELLEVSCCCTEVLLSHEITISLLFR